MIGGAARGLATRKGASCSLGYLGYEYAILGLQSALGIFEGFELEIMLDIVYMMIDG